MSIGWLVLSYSDFLRIVVILEAYCCGCLSSFNTSVFISETVNNSKEVGISKLRQGWV